mmetsp:Transcript_16913/g.2782  ORF Transcript_16913/g.2782 Transcript_16913/m.2782 type:complete len:81 (+) Transcript_16913:635-877(+)
MGGINYFNATDSSHNFGCVSDSSDNIYIYGFKDDIDVNILGAYDYFMDIKFKIGSFIAPDYDGADTDYLWTLEVLRQNTR